MQRSRPRTRPIPPPSAPLAARRGRALALAFGLLVAACAAEEPAAVVHSAADDRVQLMTEEGASIWFIDAGTNIMVLEMTPDGAESVIEDFIGEGASASEIFAILAPIDAEPPAMLTSARAQRPIDGAAAPAFRASGVDGIYSSCQYFTSDEWPDFVESTHSTYDQYYHVSSSNSNLSHDSYAGARRYYATMCAVHTHKYNTPPADALNYEGWRRTVGGTWIKQVDLDVPQGVRLRHWDDPGSDGWQWRVAVKDVPAAPGCSFVCNPGEHHTSQMWDWN